MLQQALINLVDREDFESEILRLHLEKVQSPAFLLGEKPMSIFLVESAVASCPQKPEEGKEKTMRPRCRQRDYR